MSWRVIDEGYWREPLDPTIPMTHGGQFFKFFHQHVHPLHLKASDGSFHQYADLPAELQLRVIQQCEAPTLFQLMHTTRDLRAESKKLFFSDQRTWYRLIAEILLDCSHPGESRYDSGFLASIEQLVIECDFTLRTWLPENAWETPAYAEDDFDFFTEHINTGITKFWRTVQSLCPQVKRVMLSTEGGSHYDSHPVTDCYRKMAQLCPRGIDVFFYTYETENEAAGRRRRRVLWQLRLGQGDTATVITPKRIEQSEAPGVFVQPPDKAHRGRVGDFWKAQMVWMKFVGHNFAAEFYRAAAIEKYYFEGQHKPFGCLRTDCGAWFEQPEQYTTHLLATGHGKDEAAPARVEALVAENTKRLERLRQEQLEAHERFWDWWGEWSREPQTMAEKEVLNQLENDALYAADKPATEHGALRFIYAVMGGMDM